MLTFLLNLESETLDPCIALHEIFTEIINSPKDVKAETEVKVFLLLLKLVLDLKTLAVTQLFFSICIQLSTFSIWTIKKVQGGGEGGGEFLAFLSIWFAELFF